MYFPYITWICHGLNTTKLCTSCIYVHVCVSWWWTTGGWSHKNPALLEVSGGTFSEQKDLKAMKCPCYSWNTDLQRNMCPYLPHPHRLHAHMHKDSILIAFWRDAPALRDLWAAQGTNIDITPPAAVSWGVLNLA